MFDPTTTGRGLGRRFFLAVVTAGTTLRRSFIGARRRMSERPDESRRPQGRAAMRPKASPTRCSPPSTSRRSRPRSRTASCGFRKLDHRARRHRALAQPRRSSRDHLHRRRRDRRIRQQLRGADRAQGRRYRPETNGTSHWWQNTGNKTVVLFVGRYPPRQATTRTCDGERCRTRRHAATPGVTLVPAAPREIRHGALGTTTLATSLQMECTAQLVGRAAAHGRHRAHGLSHRRRPVRDAGHPAVAGAAPIGVTPAAMGFAVNASTIGMAVAGLVGRVVQPAHRPAPGHPGQPCAARDPDRAARRRARSHHLHGAAHRAGLVHGGGVHAHARLSRRGVQRGRRRRRVRRLHHRQCREQSDRPPDLGRGRRPPGPCRELLFLRGAQSRRRGAGLLHRRSHPADAAGRSAALARRSRPGRSICATRTARRVRHRLLHPVRVHRHVHLRELRAGAPAAVARPDGARLRLFRVPALDRHDAARRPRRRSASARDRRCGRRWRSPASACRCCCCRASPQCCSAWCSSASARSSRRRPRPASSSRAATADRGSASGIYLACYFAGGLVGSAILGQVFDRIGWPACVAGIALSLVAAALLTLRLRMPSPTPTHR